MTDGQVGAIPPDDVPVGGYARYTFPDGCSKCRFPYFEGTYHKCPHDLPRRLWPRCERCDEPMAPMVYHRCRPADEVNAYADLVGLLDAVSPPVSPPGDLPSPP